MEIVTANESPGETVAAPAPSPNRVGCALMKGRMHMRTHSYQNWIRILVCFFVACWLVGAGSVRAGDLLQLKSPPERTWASGSISNSFGQPIASTNRLSLRPEPGERDWAAGYATTLVGTGTNDAEPLRVLAGVMGGIGIVVVDRTTASEPLRIKSVIPRSPAERAGIKPDCFLISVDGTNVVSMPFTRARSMLLGPVGTSVTLDLADSKMSQTNRFTAKRGRMVFSKTKVEVIDK
ncbi:MAG: S41 family peptidase [Limisphaerales bacterium]